MGASHLPNPLVASGQWLATDQCVASKQVDHICRQNGWTSRSHMTWVMLGEGFLLAQSHNGRTGPMGNYAQFFPQLNDLNGVFLDYTELRAKVTL